ncbi:MAG TPA: hypothetical protein VE268_07600 [Herpetosiphonaceae bacterium]|nr:hypothetical protein [Herpetosiphonaceae bacterium]
MYEATPDGATNYAVFDASTAVRDIAYSADSNTFALVVENGYYPSSPNGFQLTRLNLMIVRRDGTPVSLGPQALLIDPWVKMQFSPDTRQFLVTGQNQRDGTKGLWVVDTATASATLVAASVEDWAWRP